MPMSSQWLDNLGRELLGTPLIIAFLVLLGVGLNWLARALIDRAVKHASNGVLPDRLRSVSASARRQQRARTVGSLLKSSLTGAIAAVIATMILDQIGVDITPIIASAGIVGLAIGFGAQSLVKDYLSGIFMIFEDQYGVGDRVRIGSSSSDLTEGTVEAVTLRITTLRADDGTIWHVRNGEILRVGNTSQGQNLVPATAP